MTLFIVRETRRMRAWNRREHILARQRLYSNRTAALWLAGKPAPTKPEAPVKLSPEAMAANWLPAVELDRLVICDEDVIKELGRYLTVTQRLRRLDLFRQYFADYPVVEKFPRFPYDLAAGHYLSLRDRQLRLDVQGQDIDLAEISAKLLRQRCDYITIRQANDGPTAIWRAWAQAIWATLPPNDSDIFDRPARTNSPANAHLAESMSMLLTWAKMRVPLSLDVTNWLQPDNDNYDPEHGQEPPASNVERRIRPGYRYSELKSYIAKAGPTVERRHALKGGGGDIDMRPIDITWQVVEEGRRLRIRDKTGKAVKVVETGKTIVRAGKLRIANGKTFIGGEPVETGTILSQPDKFGELLGPEPDEKEIARSNSYWRRLMSYDAKTGACRVLQPPEFKKAGKMRRQVLMTAEDRAALLAGPLPPATVYPDGLPCGTLRIGDNFIGHWISNPKGRQPLERWQDISDELGRQQEFDRWAAALPPAERKALHIASTAANLTEVGEAFGKKGKAAERFGKKILVAANNNLEKIIAA